MLPSVCAVPRCPGTNRPCGRCEAGRCKAGTNSALLLALLLPAGGPVADVAELQSATKLLHVVEHWLREEKAGRRQREVAAAAAQAAAPKRPNPLLSSKHMAFYR